MKVLLDDNLPHALRNELSTHTCFTVAYMKWGGVENDELLARAAAAGFEVMLTKDANLQYEQSLADLPIAVIVLHTKSNDMDDIRPHIPALLAALSTMLPRKITHVW
jgi:predicted nuclease of predicted toxin-antitoxin system